MELLSTLIDSHALSSTLNVFKFFMRVDESFLSFGTSWWESMRVDDNSHKSQLLSTLILVWPGLYARHNSQRKKTQFFDTKIKGMDIYDTFLKLHKTIFQLKIEE